MGISGFEPSFLVGLEAVRQAHGSRLAALAGRRLTGFAVVRFVEDGDWFADCPVVLDFHGIQRELRHSKLDELFRRKTDRFRPGRLLNSTFNPQGFGVIV